MELNLWALGYSHSGHEKCFLETKDHEDFVVAYLANPKNQLLSFAECLKEVQLIHPRSSFCKKKWNYLQFFQSVFPRGQSHRGL
jgi:hypothetical protein